MRPAAEIVGRNLKLATMTPSIEYITPAKLTSEELEVCLAILEEGQAVDVDSARKELPLAV